ncbi:Lrp/AsnC family transcriptional regulator [Gluconobacter wancherniae]|uniref:AsnC family transcriptional regulator n=1 Tax=Gluconobacter wancherniae NBRC 103581 TaxID=656744 RepID=A0A511AVZ5_9PROT|nr:Lrp/AsnC family transcriptional regulator [Gluconobacter wancherniae]MBF0852570.1 Lrp/AsnC family transcriptional regulator [Gluconobacter wancherniae]MBS1062090.1 Lrp/AsnC family transcriptional regulator [Gluconobacter wancherniae]MBS1093138.1 Lrp/AsnC family transcriptional regulator [Gluconobacter wancherniae]GBD56718.1 AsnC family transcriptional regulator [Gluconobacter wancherniae NBRC 103581]GBR64417.1 transcriptional regulator [Gluconobacter wancherniae NBRC 103581]
MHIFDKLDRQLLAILRQDGRAPVAKLAAAIGVSRGTVQLRLDRLLESGAILGFTVRARENHDTIRAIMLIEVAGKSTTTVIRSLRAVPELHALHTTNGAWDLIAEIRTDTLENFDRVLREVRMIDGVLNSETSLMLSTI